MSILNSEEKLRFYTIPSAIGSYFGVGFNTPEEQFEIDLGKESTFDDAAKKRMLLGKLLEDSVLNYFEEVLEIVISDRNETTRWFYDGKVKGKLDGTTILNGVPTGVECKVSNSSGGKFTENIGYHFQCQSYMLDGEFDQVLLCGLYEGRPIYKIIKRDEEMLADIKEMTDFVVDCLAGLNTIDNIPQHLVEKYSKKEELQPLDDTFKDYYQRVFELKQEIASKSKELDEITDFLKANISTGEYKTDTFKFTMCTQTRAGGYDIDKLSIEHPEIDLSKYRKPDSKSTVIRTSAVKSKK